MVRVRQWVCPFLDRTSRTPRTVFICNSHHKTIAVDPGLNKPTRMYPLQPIHLPAVYVAGEKAGQKVMPGAARGPQVWGVQDGVPAITLPGMSDGTPDEGGMLLPRRKKPLKLPPPQPSKRRKIGAHPVLSLLELSLTRSSDAVRFSTAKYPSHQSAEPPVPPQIENQQPLMHHGIVSDTGFSQATQEGVDQGEAQSQGKGSGSNTHHELFEGQTRVLEQRQAKEPSTGSSLQHFPTAVPVTPPCPTTMPDCEFLPGFGYISLLLGGGSESGRPGAFRSFPTLGFFLIKTYSRNGMPLGPRTIPSYWFKRTGLETVNQ